MTQSYQESTIGKYVNVELLGQVIEVDIDRVVARLSRERGITVSDKTARKWRHSIERSVERSVEKICSAHTVPPDLDAIIQKELQQLEEVLLKSIESVHRKKKQYSTHRFGSAIKHFFACMNSKRAVKRQNSIALKSLIP